MELGPLCISTGFHEMEHAFVLKNTSRNQVTIVRMTASCGCVEIASDRRDVRPGEDVRITMRFDLDPGGVQFYRGFVHLSDESVVPLSITVRGQRASQLSTAVPIAVVGREAAVVELQYVAYEMNADAPQLAIDGPKGLSLQVGSWRQVGYMDSGAGSPSRWFTTLTIGPWNDRSITGEASPEVVRVSAGNEVVEIMVVRNNSTTSQ